MTKTKMLCRYIMFVNHFEKTEPHIGTAYDKFVYETAVTLWSEHHGLNSMSQRIRRSMR